MDSARLAQVEIACYMAAFLATMLAIVGWCVHLARPKVRAVFGLAWGLTLGAALALTACLTARGFQPTVPRMPLTTMFEITVLVQIGALGALLVVTLRSTALRFAAPPTIAVVVALWLYGYSKHRPIEEDLVAALKSVWLQVHVATAVLSYGPLFLSGVTSAMASVMFLIGGRLTDKGPPREGMTEPTPSIAEQYELWTYRIIAFGFPWLSALIITGAVWANYAWGRAWGWDPKEMWSAITWVIYVAYLHMRGRRGWRGLPASLTAVSAWGAMIVTYLLVNWIVQVLGVQSLHAYAY